MWVVFALAASLFWGAAYLISEYVYKSISVPSALAITLTASGLILALVAFGSGLLTKDLATIASSPRVAWLIVAGIAVLAFAELCIGLSIAGKNATIAGLIEISYPIFIAFFSYFLYKESHLSLATIVGGGFVFVGIGIIYAFNR